MAVDTTYYLQPGESTDAYNKRIATYNASKNTSSSAPVPTQTQAQINSQVTQNQAAAAKLGVSISGVSAGNATQSPVSSAPAPAAQSGIQYLKEDAQGGVQLGATYYGPGNKLPSGYEYESKRPTQTGAAPTTQIDEMVRQNQEAAAKLGVNIPGVGGGSAGAQPTQTQAPQGNLQPGQQGAQVQELQNYLASLGYLTPQQIATGPGMYGPQTQAAVAKLQQDLGVSAGQNAGYYGPLTREALAKKYNKAFSTLSKGPVPAGPSEAMNALNNYFDSQPEEKNSQQAYFEQLFGLNPVESVLFSQLTSLMSSTNDRESISQIYADEVAKSGVQPLQEDLAQTIADVRLTEDQVRKELSQGGGVVLEGQVQAISNVRTKALLTKAEQLSNIIDSKNAYIDNIVKLTQADRADVDKEIDRKIGLTSTLLDFATKMDDRARANYQQLIKDTGYDGLVSSITSQAELENVSRSLGMTPDMLLKLGSQKTTAQRAQQLDEMAFQLSVDKFNEDKRQFGLNYALEKQKVATQAAATAVITPYATERALRTIQSVDELMPKVSAKTVGMASLSAIIPGTDARNFKTELDTLKSNIITSELTAMREASKTGGALGQISDRESTFLQAALGGLDQGQSPENFKKQLQKVKDSVYRWNAQSMSLAKGYDYEGMKQEGYSDEEIYNSLR